MQMNIVIETVKGSREKFNYQPATSTFHLKKLLPLGMGFPYDFGFIPATIGDDGDPLDAVVISEIKTFTGCNINCRLIGAVQIRQTEEGKSFRNDRYVFIPEDSQEFAHIDTVAQLPKEIRKQLEAFFIQYNKLVDKKLKILQWISARSAISFLQAMQGRPVEPTRLTQLFIPMYDNKRKQFPQTHFHELKRELMKKFGGVSVYEQTPVTGLWREGKEGNETDHLIIFEVMSLSPEITYWKELRTKLEKRFKQKELLIRQLAIGKI
jgi:inorganic pyrophosphatase